MKPNGQFILVCLLCGLGVVLFLAAMLPSQPLRNAPLTQNGATSSENRSSIRFSERTMRLAPVHSGETASGFVLVENTGRKVIADVAVKVGCRCTDVTLSDTNIQSRNSIRVNFSIDTKGKYADFTDNFLFTYFESGQNLYGVFHVTVPILAPGKLIAEPSSLQFNKARGGESFSRNIELRLKDLPENESVDIVDISTPDWMSINHEKQGTLWKLTLTGVLPVQSGRYVEFVQIKSTSERYSEMVIPVIVEYVADADTHR